MPHLSVPRRRVVIDVCFTERLKKFAYVDAHFHSVFVSIHLEIWMEHNLFVLFIHESPGSGATI